jgi:hypothetical protein
MILTFCLGCLNFDKAILKVFRNARRCPSDTARGIPIYQKVSRRKKCYEVEDEVRDFASRDTLLTGLNEHTFRISKLITEVLVSE